MRMYVREDRGRFPPVVSTNGKHTHYTSPREKQETHKDVKNTFQPWSYTSHTFGVNIHSTYLNALKSNILITK